MRRTRSEIRTQRGAGMAAVGDRVSVCSPGYRILLSWGLVAMAGCVGARPGGAAPKIYIVTDLEGASGVYKFAQCRDPESPLGREAREYLMGDIAAVVRGLRDAGAGDILVLDGHGSQAFVPHLAEPGARYVTGLPRPEVLWGLDGTYAGCVLLAHHARMGTPDGVLHHTQNSRTEDRYWYNGVESGELAQCAAIAGHFGVPTILVTGDEATCREARAFFGAECVTVAVKAGVSRESAVLYPFAQTRKALYEGARRSIAAIPRCRPYRLAMPVHAKRQYLVFDTPTGPGRVVTREETIDDILRLARF